MIFAQKMIDSPLAFVSGIKGIALAWIAAARRNQARKGNTV
jgi:hypothetical protein